jgi:DNA-binding transcriptional ArsR family regulator
MADHAAKATRYDALADAAKALSNGRRAELIDVLTQGERSVEELAGEIDQTVANTSQHLHRLLRAGLVSSRRDGTRIHYSLASPAVAELWRNLRRTSEQHVADLDRLAAAGSVALGEREAAASVLRVERVGGSDGAHELVECCAESVSIGCLGGDVVVAAAQVLHEGMAGGECAE